MLTFSVKLSILELLLVEQALHDGNGTPWSLEHGELSAKLNRAATSALRRSQRAQQTSESSIPSEAGA